MPDDFDPASLTDEQIAAVLRYAGQRNSEKRERRDHRCDMCGAILENVVRKRRYCSDACRVRASYYRDKTNDPTAPFKVQLGSKGWQQKRPLRRKGAPE